MRFGVAIAATAALVLLAGCSDDGKNAPLPRASKARTMRRARDLAEGVAGAAGLTAGDPTPETKFAPCVGAGGEEAGDARYELGYYVRVDVPLARENAVGSAMRAYMRAHSYDNVSYRPYHDQYDDLALTGYSGSWYVSVATLHPAAGPDRQMTIAVSSPCYLPPGAVQKAQ